ncbi:molybdopterin-dependent oxidoreductase [Sphingopyxis sp. BSNA05]|uniref:molybdopterin-dependent oxidoreductase n=1 Tax=Sphingopyxis sp. BSNA05 TaxID=1236614 RepID=UPI001566096B|nr:molybdopterin-dependent oxidoreductase [Sphingopyxis sp. BSNA05]
MLIGTNPVVSMNGGLGMNPAKKLHDAKKRGMQLIVIDPRVTDSAKQADIHLQCRPGQDPILLGAIAKIVINEELYDKDFVAGDVDGFEALKKAVQPFDAGPAADRAGVAAEDIVRAARMYGSWKKASISGGTGTNMSGGGNITEYLNLALTSIMGHWLREGDLNRRTGVFTKPAPPIAATPGPIPAWGFGRKLHSRDLEQSISGMPTSALPDEILTPGDKQVKALICLGGNPMLAWPDQLKTFEAMKALDLLVCIDPRMSKTAELADYVIAPKLHYEVHGNTAAPEIYGGFGAGWGFENNYAQASPPIMQSPEGPICARNMSSSTRSPRKWTRRSRSSPGHCSPIPMSGKRKQRLSRPAKPPIRSARGAHRLTDARRISPSSTRMKRCRRARSSKPRPCSYNPNRPAGKASCRSATAR